ncbi:MAG: acetate/propionate family kinase [Acidimicrobiales bacterium]|nr:acetate/propionate family kinase [Acidimicrobiales bacterium]MCB9395686.1 acetate/propionate family kinase [Acidimicrobiaceae bacterium]
MNVLAVNAGGVTLELAVVDADATVVTERLVDPWDGRDTSPITDIARECRIDAVGHRVVHGGTHVEAQRIDDVLVADLDDAASLAPVHQGRTLLAIRAARSAIDRVPHVACFDTTFHLTLPAAAATYPLPREWRHRWALRRVGFHGLSHAYVARRAADLAGSHPSRRIVSCHLGSGASVCAIEAGRSIDTTMGMTPMEGLMMVTRSGTIDPGLLLWLLDGGGLTVEEVSEGLNTRSGLAGIAGGSGDMRDVVHRRARSDPEATLAFDIYVHRLRQGIAAMAASLGGVDVLAFTGGVGQHMAEVRAVTVAGLAHLGLAVDHDRNRGTSDDADISARDAPARCVVVATGEHHSIAAETRRVLGRSTTPERNPHAADP